VSLLRGGARQDIFYYCRRMAHLEGLASVGVGPAKSLSTLVEFPKILVEFARMKTDAKSWHGARSRGEAHNRRKINGTSQRKLTSVE